VVSQRGHSRPAVLTRLRWAIVPQLEADASAARLILADSLSAKSTRAAMSDSNYDNRTFTIAQCSGKDGELKCSRAHTNKLLRTGQLEHSKLGSRVIIRGRAIRKLLDAKAVTS
jgi:hypothetical protein